MKDHARILPEQLRNNDENDPLKVRRPRSDTELAGGVSNTLATPDVAQEIETKLVEERGR